MPKALGATEQGVAAWDEKVDNAVALAGELSAEVFDVELQAVEFLLLGVC